MQSLSFDVGGMTRGGCTGSVQRTLSKLDGIGDAVLTLHPGIATVAEEFVLFNRSWYNRAGVERVMGFCTKDEHEEFMQSVPKFEEMLVDSGIKLLKYYLDIGKNEQTRRLAERKRDPLKQWKSSPIDAVAVKHWKAYSEAPWHIVRADDNRLARPTRTSRSSSRRIASTPSGLRADSHRPESR